MKKLLTWAFIFLSMCLMFGCSQKESIKENFSEITYNYYSGKSADGKMSASISVGEREEPYIIDGKHGDVCAFSLLIVKFDFYIEENEITIEFCSNSDRKSIVLEFNPLNSTYMADLGYSIAEGKDYSIKYANYALTFSNTSSTFKVDYNLAIQKSIGALGDRASSYYNGNSFRGECYLKIFSKTNGGSQDLFWIFTIVGENDKSSNVVIDIQKGEVILSN